MFDENIRNLIRLSVEEAMIRAAIEMTPLTDYDLIKQFRYLMWRKATAV